MTLIYKILRTDEWQDLQHLGETKGAAIDVADGYIHFSTAQTVYETAAKHFAGEDGLKLLAYDDVDFGKALVYEPARDGILFPHLYALLPYSLAKWVKDLPLGANGHDFAGLLECDS